MKHQLTTFVLLLATGIVLGSCLGHDNDNSVDYSFYNDAAVTAFSLGSLKMTARTLSSKGEDSLYTLTYTPTAKFYIDHEKCLIYNPDSLPYSTQVDRVLASISSKNSGVLLWQNLELRESDGATTYTYHTSSDSIDFTKERTLRVTALNGETWRDYTVKVNVHKEAADTMNWQVMSSIEELTTMQHLKMVAVGNNHFILGSNGSSTQLWTGGTDGSSWAASNMLLDADAWKNTVVKDDNLFILNGNSILKLNGSTWSTITPDKTIQQLVAASSAELFAFSTDGKIMASTDEGATWKEEPTDDATAPIPTDDISFTLRPLKTNSEIERVTIFGTTAASKFAIAWSKIIDTTNSDINDSWTFVDAAGDTRYVAPKLGGLTVLDYDDADFAFGLKNNSTMNTPLKSIDGGITWKANSSVKFPKMAIGEPFSITADSNNYLWIVDKNGQIWRGRINRLGWENKKEE